jgi:hypothetical protein
MEFLDTLQPIILMEYLSKKLVFVKFGYDMRFSSILYVSLNLTPPWGSCRYHFLSYLRLLLPEAPQELVVNQLIGSQSGSSCYLCPLLASILGQMIIRALIH